MEQPRLTTSFGAKPPTPTSTSTPSLALRHTLGIAPNPSNIINKRTTPTTIDPTSGFHRVVNSTMPRVGTQKSYVNQTFTHPSRSTFVAVEPKTTIRQSVTPTYLHQTQNPIATRESVAPKEGNYKIISETVYRGPPTIVNQSQTPQSIIANPIVTLTNSIQNDDSAAYNLMREDNRRLGQRVMELSAQKDKLEWELNAKNQQLFEYERRIQSLGRELENLGGNFKKSERDFLTSKDIFDQNLTYLRNSYLLDRENLVGEIQRLHDHITHSQNGGGGGGGGGGDAALLEKNQMLRNELSNLQKNYDDLVQQVDRDIKNINNDESLNDLRNQNMELRSQLAAALQSQNYLHQELERVNEDKLALQKSISPLQRSMASSPKMSGNKNRGEEEKLRKENLELKNLIADKDQIISNLELDCRRFAELARNNQEGKTWC